ncbi:MAG: hypothetical protein ACK5N0_02570 [Synechococcaceae cyanobacterium]
MDGDRNASQSGFSGDEHLKERLNDLETRIKSDVEMQLLGPKFEWLEITQKVSRIVSPGGTGAVRPGRWGGL